MSIIFNVVIALAAGAVLLGLVAQLPPIPQEALDAFATAMGWASSVGNLVPVETIFRIVGLVVLIEGVFLTMRIVRWLWGRLSASGTND